MSEALHAKGCLLKKPNLYARLQQTNTIKMHRFKDRPNVVCPKFLQIHMNSVHFQHLIQDWFWKQASAVTQSLQSRS
jgi:hypothetical protein